MAYEGISILFPAAYRPTHLAFVGLLDLPFLGIGGNPQEVIVRCIRDHSRSALILGASSPCFIPRHGALHLHRPTYLSASVYVQRSKMEEVTQDFGKVMTHLGEIT